MTKSRSVVAWGRVEAERTEGRNYKLVVEFDRYVHYLDLGGGFSSYPYMINYKII